MNKWKKLSEKIVFNGWRKMIQKSFELPNGKTSTFDIIGNNPFVSVAAFTTKKEAIIVKQFRPGPEQELWSFPEGYIDEGEDIYDAAKRELMEETGYLPGSLSFIRTFHQAYSTETKYVLLATDCQKIQNQSLDENEFIGIELMEVDELRKFMKEERNPVFTTTDVAYLALDKLNWL